jgi:hypothetical protein
MKASHLSLRHPSAAVNHRSLAAASFIAFFAAGYADARPKGPFNDPAM